MALVVPAGMAIVALRFSLINDPEEMVTTFGGGNEPFGQDQAEAIADHWEEVFTPAWMSSSYTFKGVSARVSDGAGGYTVVEEPRSVVGEAAATTVPQNCAFLVRKLTAVAGRSGRGRFYFPPFLTGEDSVNAAGVILTAALEGIQAQIDTWKGGQLMYLFHDETSPRAGLADLVTQLVLEQRIATQRRRLRP